MGTGSGAPAFVDLIVRLKDFWDAATLTWTLSAIGSGVIGNYAYDKIKDFATRSGDQLPHQEHCVANERAVQAIALYAVRLRCAQLHLPQPPFATLRVERCRRRAVRGNGPDYRGPYRDIDITGGDAKIIFEAYWKLT